MFYRHCKYNFITCQCCYYKPNKKKHTIKCVDLKIKFEDVLPSKQSCLQGPKGFLAMESKTAEDFWTEERLQMFVARELKKNKNKTLHFNFIHIDDHAPSVVERRCVTALWLNCTVQVDFFHNTVNEKEHNILKYPVSAARIVWINKSQICSCTHFSILDPSKKLSIN